MNVQSQAKAATRISAADPIWFLGLANWIRADRVNSQGNISVVEGKIPVGYASPWHLHHDEHEAFLVLEGEMEVTVGDDTVILGEGAFGFGPMGIPHGFRITGDKTARVIMMTSGPHFADFVREVSQPWSDTPPPPPGPEEMPRLMELAEKHNLTIFGPMAS